MNLKIAAALAGALLIFAGAANLHAAPKFEDLGMALEGEPMSINVSTTDAQGRQLAFGRVHDKGNNHYDIFVVDLESGATEWLGLQDKFGLSYIQTQRAANGDIYIFSGDPGNFSKYDVNARKLVDLGHPGSDKVAINYHFGHDTAPDGKIYVGGYPSAHVFVCDPATDTIADLGNMSSDPRNQKYTYAPQVDGKNEWLYVPLGLHHLELCAFNLKTGEKRQILPPELTALPGNPTVQRCADGNVYGKAALKDGDRLFLCKPDGIEYVEKIPAGDPEPVPQMLEGINFSQIGEDGKLTVTAADGKTKEVQTPLHGITYSVYSVGCERDGIIYGGGGNGRTNVFSYDPKSGDLRDLGRGSSGRIQIYDLLDHPKGLYLASYTGANLDLFDPKTAEREHIIQLSLDHGQERLQRLTMGPDGMIYTGGVPIKGRLGGAIIRLNPDDHKVTVWRDVITSQSFNVGVAVPATNEMFFTSSIRGGSSAVPTEKEAYVILWDCAGEKEAWRGQPIDGATDYGYATMAGNGIIYGIAGQRYYAFDPVKREVIHRGELPVGVGSLGLAHEPAGPDGLIYGMGDGAIFAIDPADHSVQVVAKHPSLERGHGFYAATDGTLYYGSGSHLWRAILNP